MKLTPHQKYYLQKNIRRALIVLIGLLVVVVFRIKGCQPQKEASFLRGSENRTGVGQTLYGSTMTAFDDTVKIWQLKTDWLLQDIQSSQIKVAPVRLKMFNKNGTVAVNVTADSGVTSNKMETFYIWGRVVITDAKGNRLRSKSLHWEKPQRKLHSEDYVEISTSKGELLRGKGFDAAEDISWWEFHQDVSGRFVNFDKEMGFGGSK